MSDKARAELAPTGVLRAGINLSNFLLVTGRSATAEPEGVAPDMAREIAKSLGVPVHYVVPPGSPIRSIDQVDLPGVRIAVSARSAYGLWLENNIRKATLMPISGLDAAFNKFRDEKLEVLAGLRPGLLKDIEKMPGATILPGKFSAVQQAVGTAKPNRAGAEYLAAFVEQAKKSGLVASLIEKHHVKGLSVAPPADR